MSVSVWVHHELDPTFDPLKVLVVMNLIENRLNYSINTVFANFDDSVYDLMLHVYMIDVDAICLLIRTHYGLSCLPDNCFENALNETYSGVHSDLLSHRSPRYVNSELLLCLLEHSLLLSSHALAVHLFLLSILFLLLSDIFVPAILASTLRLARSEIVEPDMTTLATYSDYRTVSTILDNSDPCPFSSCLHTRCIDNSGTVVTNLVLSVTELPESDLTTATRLLILGLLLAALLNRRSECRTDSFIFYIVTFLFRSGGCFARGVRRRGRCNRYYWDFISTCSLGGDSTKIWLIDVLRVLWDLDADFSEESIDRITCVMTVLLMMNLRLRLRMRGLLGIWIHRLNLLLLLHFISRGNVS